MVTDLIRIAPISRDEQLNSVIEVQRAAWNLDDISLVPPHVFTAIIKAGGMLLGAYAGAELVGFVVGIVSREERTRDVYLTSHMMGVRPEWQSRSVGFSLKSAQGAWARDHGIPVVRWTFDPMEARNANLNIRKLGGRVIQFVPDYYGAGVGSAQQRGLPSDRFVLEWDTRLEHNDNSARMGEQLISLSANDVSLCQELNKLPAIQSAQLPVPLDFQRLKEVDFKKASSWQRAVRVIGEELINKYGMWISGFHPDTATGIGYYVLTKR